MHPSILDVSSVTTPASRSPAAWDELAATVAATRDRAEVARIVQGLAAERGVRIDACAPLVVLQRTFGRLHRMALSPVATR